MLEENVQENAEETSNQDEQLQPELSNDSSELVDTSIEERARSEGWVPKEEWDDTKGKWRPAEEFLDRGELFHKISNQSSEIKELKKAIGALTEHHQKVKETEFKRALEYLKQQKKTALEEGDADKLLAVDEAIDTLKEERQAEERQTPQQKAGPTPHFVSWVQTNQWYLKDPELRAFADDVGVGAFQRAGGNIGEAELYEMVKRRVMKQFPEKFKGNGKPNSAVEGSSGTAAPRKTDNFKLTEDEERVMKTFVRQGVMTKEQYIADLKAVKGIS